jgi:hypothetical protein
MLWSWISGLPPTSATMTVSVALVVDEPVDQPTDRRRQYDHHGKDKRPDAPERLSHAAGDLRLLGFVDEETAARTEKPAIVGLEHVAAFDTLECNLFETLVKPGHDTSSALPPMMLTIGRGGAAGGSKPGRERP